MDEVEVDGGWETLSPPPSETGAVVFWEDGDWGSVADGSSGPGLTGPAEPIASPTVGDNVPRPHSSPTSSGVALAHEALESQSDIWGPTSHMSQSSTINSFVSHDERNPSWQTSVTPCIEQSPERSGEQNTDRSTSSTSPVSDSEVMMSDASQSQHHFGQNSLPPQERRIRMHTRDAAESFSTNLRMSAPFVDKDGSPVFVGSALIDGAVYPCKVTLARLGEAGITPVRVPLGGRELVHHGVYEILLIDEETMEWVGARKGRLPFGRAPVEGGYSESSKRLYYAATTLDGYRVPGRTREHEGANFSWAGKELVMRDNYDVLCWRPQYYLPHHSRDPNNPLVAPFTDKGGKTPVYVVSAPLGRTRQPGKATFHGDNQVRVHLPNDGKEVDTDWASAEQPVEILNIDPDIMEWVPTHHGRLPIGMQPVEGGYDHDDRRFYHATYVFDGCIVPGKTGEHLHGARFPWGGKEQGVECGYKILCWKRRPELKGAHTWLVPPPPLLLAKCEMRSEDKRDDGGICAGVARHDDGSYHPGSVSQEASNIRVYPHGGRAIMDFSDSYDVLRFDEDRMEWVCQVKNGEVAAERRPVEAGYEKSGEKLFFARHNPSTPYIYGKTGKHLKSGHFVQDGKELVLHASYDVLCWRDD